MKVLLTGAAGFLGSHIAAKLLSQGHEVIGLDDFSTGSQRNLLAISMHPSFQFIEADVRVPIHLEVDAIMNFACPASPVHYQSDPVRTIETNFIGIINLLHLAKETGARILQASTSEVYGDPEISPQNEEYWGNVNPIGIRSCYDEGKRAAETLCFDYMRQYGLDTRVIRIFNTYGPNMAVSDGRVVSNFIVQAINGNPLTIYGDGSQSRSFCYVDDLIDGIYRTLMLEGPVSKPINLGNPNEFSMLELAQVVLKLTSSTSSVEFRPLPEDDPKQRCPDISRAKSILGWEPSVTLEQGINMTQSYFRTVLHK